MLPDTLISIEDVDAEILRLRQCYRGEGATVEQEFFPTRDQGKKHRFKIHCGISFESCVLIIS